MRMGFVDHLGVPASPLFISHMKKKIIFSTKKSKEMFPRSSIPDWFCISIPILK